MEQLCFTKNQDLTPTPYFDKSFKTIITYNVDGNYYHLLDWLNSNSRGKVEIKLSDSMIDNFTVKAFIGFEYPDDALIFKIKYSI